MPPRAIEEKIEKVVGCPAFCTITAVTAAFRALGVKRIALGTPYVSFINETEIDFLEKAGFSVVSLYGLELGVTQEERRGIGRVPPHSLHRFCRHIDREDADAIFISCTNVAGIHEIAQIEAERGKPVLTSNLATFWHALRMTGVNDKIEGFGSLLAHF
jgi:arylmalonate decarboxylase